MKLFSYLKATKAELTHITWPRQNVVVIFTTAVIVVSLFIAAYVGALDYGFTLGIKEIITN